MPIETARHRQHARHGQQAGAFVTWTEVDPAEAVVDRRNTVDRGQLAIDERIRRGQQPGQRTGVVEHHVGGEQPHLLGHRTAQVVRERREAGGVALLGGQPVQLQPPADERLDAPGGARVVQHQIRQGQDVLPGQPIAALHPGQQRGVGLDPPDEPRQPTHDVVGLQQARVAEHRRLRRRGDAGHSRHGIGAGIICAASFEAGGHGASTAGTTPGPSAGRASTTIGAVS